MAIFLSLITAAIFGSGDFCGGLAAKRASIVQVVAGSHFIGLIGVTLASVVLADAFSFRALVLGAIGGLFGGIGVGFLYRRLAVGPMAVVAPITAITAAAVPALWAVATGDSLSPLAWLGVAIALVAIGLVSFSDDSDGLGVDEVGNGEDRARRVTPGVIAESLLSGIGFGAFFIFIDAADAASAPWPVVGARLLTTVGLGLFLLASRSAVISTDRASWVLIALTGVLDTTSNVIFLYATSYGSLTIVAVLSSMYPISTVLLARFVLSERMTRVQLAGFATALIATALIAAG